MKEKYYNVTNRGLCCILLSKIGQQGNLMFYCEERDRTTSMKSKTESHIANDARYRGMYMFLSWQH